MVLHLLATLESQTCVDVNQTAKALDALASALLSSSYQLLPG